MWITLSDVHLNHYFNVETSLFEILITRVSFLAQRQFTLSFTSSFSGCLWYDENLWWSAEETCTLFFNDLPPVPLQRAVTPPHLFPRLIPPPPALPDHCGWLLEYPSVKSVHLLFPQFSSSITCPVCRLCFLHLLDRRGALHPVRISTPPSLSMSETCFPLLTDTLWKWLFLAKSLTGRQISQNVTKSKYPTKK